MKQDPDHILDFRGSLSSIALLKITRIFNEMGISETLEIVGADPDTRKDLFKVLPESAYEVIFAEGAEDAAGSYRLRIRKRR